MNKKQKTILERGDYVTDYVANGSFKSLKDNVTYNKNKDYAILLRLVDYTKGFNGPFTYVDKHSYDFLKKSSVQPGDIIISNVGENVGTVFKAPDLGQPMTLGPNSILVRMGNEDAAFWYYWFNSSEGQFKLKSIVSSSAQPKFNKTSFRELTVPDVSILQQRKVASVLSALDDKIELNRKINIELEQMARTLYDYWFVQFDFPDANGKPYKSSGGQMAYNDQLKRNIPAGWSAVKLNDFTKIVSGFPFKSSTYIEDGRYKVITIKNVKSGELDSSGADTIDDVPKNLPDNCRLDVGDLLVSLTGNVGRMAFVTEYDLLLNQRVGKLEVSSNHSLEYIYLLLTRPEEEQRIQSLASGSSQANLSPIQAIDFHTINPDPAVLSKFQETVGPMFAKIIANRQESQNLAELRDWLLPMLMNGQVKTK